MTSSALFASPAELALWALKQSSVRDTKKHFAGLGFVQIGGTKNGPFGPRIILEASGDTEELLVAERCVAMNCVENAFVNPGGVTGKGVDRETLL